MADFDARQTALQYAGDLGSMDGGLALVCGLVYVGDQVGELVKQREVVDAEVVDTDWRALEWLAMLSPEVRDWAHGFPSDLLGHPLLAAAIESAANNAVPLNDVTRNGLVKKVRAQLDMVRSRTGMT